MEKKTNSPIFALAAGRIQGVLAIVTRTEGPSYRAVGATMVFADDGRHIGSLSSGCIESDLAIHAETVRETGRPQVVLYGRGSPYMDITLPCGGGLEILLVPQPAPAALALINQVVAQRQETTISISRETGAITAGDGGADAVALHLVPPLQFCIFGKGPEATHFAQLAQALGYEGVLLSPDPETLAALDGSNWTHIMLTNMACPSNLHIDSRTAAILFFHDHEWEAPILTGLLDSDAFYIGAQGSKRAGDARLMELQAMGATQAQCDRIVGPIGLIPSTRDPQTLAVSVLAEILSKAQAASQDR